MTPEALVRLAEIDNSICLEVDLHESSLQLDPLRHVVRAIHDAERSGKEVVKVIHGRGAGVLQEKLRRFLLNEQRKGTIAYVRSSDRLDELGAVLYVVPK